MYPCHSGTTSSHAAVVEIFSQKETPVHFWTDALYFNETKALDQLLKYTKDALNSSGVWASNTELDGIPIRSRCLALGGSSLEKVKGEADFLFYALPQIPLRLIF